MCVNGRLQNWLNNGRVPVGNVLSDWYFVLFIFPLFFPATPFARIKNGGVFSPKQDNQTNPGSLEQTNSFVGSLLQEWRSKRMPFDFKPAGSY